MDVDAGRIGLMDEPSDDRPTVGDVPPAALDGPDHDLGYLVLPREADQGPAPATSGVAHAMTPGNTAQP